MKTILTALRDSEKIYRAKLLKAAKQNGVTIAEWHLLGFLRDGIDTQDKLASETGLDNSTLSRQLGSLYKKELVTNTAIGRDKRQLVYELTPVGIQCLESVNEAHQRLEQSVFARWDDEESRMLQILLNRLEKSLNNGQVD